MLLIDLFEDLDTNFYKGYFSKAKTIANVQQRLGKRFNGKAKIWNLPYTSHMYATDSDPWWTVMVINKNLMGKVSRSLTDFAKQENLDINITSDFDELPDTIHGILLLNQIKHHLDHNLTENEVMLYIFFSPAEQEEPPSKVYYHVTYNQSVAETGIKLGQTLKWKNRIYLWDNLDKATYFAFNSYHAKNIAYIFAVTDPGKVYRDAEEPEHAVYVKNSIPSNHLKLIKTLDVNFRRT